MITLYLYNNTTLVYEGRLIGSNIDDALSDIADEQDFTLQPPPNYYDKWRWDGLQWVKDDSSD